MNQTRIGSLIEACVNILIGFTINWVANMAILPMFGFHVSGGQAFQIGLLFTAISIIRSYAIRRWFNAYLHRMSQRLAGVEPPAPVMVATATPDDRCQICWAAGHFACHCPTEGVVKVASSRKP